jgi:RND family efflux transporter MFP subunit
MKLRWLAPLLLLACASPGGGSAPAAGDAGGAAGTPVRVAAVERTTLTIAVTGSGRTDALEQQKVRAPFKGKLASLLVADGDHVRDGQIVGEMISLDSESALIGAQSLLASAHTAQARADARRALKLAREGLVRAPLRAPEAAVVVSHGADEGSLVAEGQDIVSLAASDSFIFRADIVQTDLPRVRPGQAVVVRLPSSAQPVPGTVHSVLPAASATDLTVPVRVDLHLSGTLAIGLFGTARITVGEARDVIALPAAAVLRDDVTGKERVALVAPDGKAHWEDVTTGLRSGGFVEIRAPPLAPGARAIVQGQIGLPEGAPVQVTP